MDCERKKIDQYCIRMKPLSGLITLMVSDLDRAVKFYTDILEFKLQFRAGEHFAQVETKGLTIGLHPKHGKPKKSDKSDISIGLAVENLQEAIAELKKKGVTFSRVTKDGPIELAFSLDPDGHELYLAETK